uniref:Pyr_redox_2 domain-containing protein n=1 Tax=Macrostomum lignano TaxID=282301 RepID=A0A1I8FGJ0_9PLAT
TGAPASVHSTVALTARQTSPRFQAAEHQYDFVIVGGGIAGVTCAETLAAVEPGRPGADCVALACGQSRHQPAARHQNCWKSSTLRLGSSAPRWPIRSRQQPAKLPVRIGYGELCLCTGASPKLIPQARQHPDLVVAFATLRQWPTCPKKLSTCRRVLVVGNGGIATELLRNVDVVWAFARTPSEPCSLTARAQFLLPSLARPGGVRVDKPGVTKHRSNGELLGVDLIVSATGVTATALLADGGVVRRWMLRAPWPSTAACAAPWRTCSPPVTLAAAPVWSSDGETSSRRRDERLALWFRMRLWSRPGAAPDRSFAARCMSAARRGGHRSAGHRLRAVHPRHPVFQLQIVLL